MIICLHLEVVLQCQRAELSSLTGTRSREALPGSLRPFLFTDGHPCWSPPLVESHCYSWGEIPGVLAQFHGGFLRNGSSSLPITKKGLCPLDPSSSKAVLGKHQETSEASSLHQSKDFQIPKILHVFLWGILPSNEDFWTQLSWRSRLYGLDALSHWRGWNTWVFFCTSVKFFCSCYSKAYVEVA